MRCGLLLFRSGGGGGSASSARLHGLHEPLEVLLGVALRLGLGGLVQPLGVVLDTVMTVTIPPSVEISIVPVAKPVIRLVLRIPLAPVLGPLDALPLGHRGCVRVTAGCVVSEPGVRLSAPESVPPWGLGLVAVLIARPMLKIAVISAAGVPIVAVPCPASVVPGAKAVISAAAHAAVEALGALVAEALARLHGAPTVAVLILVRPPAEARDPALSPISPEPVAGIV